MVLSQIDDLNNRLVICTSKTKFVLANQQELKHIARKGGKKRVKMYLISHCAKMYYNGSSRLAGIGAPKHGCRVSSEGSRAALASALCKAPAVGGGVPLRGRHRRHAPLYRGGSGLVARHPADAEKNSRRRELQLSACCNFAVEEQSRRLRLYFTTPQSALFQCVPGPPPLVRSSHSYTHCAPQWRRAAPPTSIAHLELFY